MYDFRKYIPLSRSYIVPYGAGFLFFFKSEGRITVKPVQTYM